MSSNINQTTSINRSSPHGADEPSPGGQPEPIDSETPGLVAYTDFDDMGLPENLLRGVYSVGFEKPSAIQQKAVVPAGTGRDIIMHAQSGTGKSGAFTIGLLQRVDASSAARPSVQALILSPTRDLALQTQRVVQALGRYMGIDCHASIGGRGARDDAIALRKHPHVVTGTPGRVLDNITRGAMDPSGIRVLVLDEVDVMLDEGFRESVQQIFRTLPASCQAIIVSATLPAAVLEVAERFLQDPIKVLIPTEEITLQGISQFYVDCGYDDAKLDVMFDLYQTLSISQSVVFVNTRRKAMWLAEMMNQEQHTVAVIHGEMSQDERDSTLLGFVNSQSRVLIATDVVARGIDVQQVSAVLNFELPHRREDYIHRIGRGGRFGRKSIAINLITPRDAEAIRSLERFYSSEIREMPADVSSFLA